MQCSARGCAGGRDAAVIPRVLYERLAIGRAGVPGMSSDACRSALLADGVGESE